MKRKKLFLIAGAILLIAGALFIFFKKKHDLANLSKPAAHNPSVQTATVYVGSIEITHHYMGTIEPFTRSDLSARISGHILQVNKREGDQVRKGELVAVIDDRELADRSQAVKADLAAAQYKMAAGKSAYETQKSIYERDITLFKAGAISKESLERSQSAYEGASGALHALEENIAGLKKSLSAAQTQTEYSRIYSPFYGTVARRWAEPGDLAVPGKPILTIEQVLPSKVLVQVPQEEITLFRKGSKVYLYNGTEQKEASISKIYPALNKNFLGTIEIQLAELPFRLPSGSTVPVDLVAGTVAGPIIPENSIVKTAKGSFAYVISKNMITVRPVEILGNSKGKSAIKGLADGEVVAVGQESRLLNLSEGTVVEAAGGKQ